MLVIICSVDRNPSSTLARGVALLQAFDVERSRLTLAQLVEATGLPKTTVHRIASDLVSTGVLVRRSGRFSPASWLLQLGEAAPETRSIRDCALPQLQWLCEGTHEAVWLGVLDRGRVICLDTLAPPGSGSTAPRRAERVLWSTTAAGKALVSGLPSDRLLDVVSAPPARRSGGENDGLRSLLADIAMARREGVAFDRDIPHAGARSISAACAVHGRPVAALTVSVSRSSRIDIADLVGPLRQATRQVEADLVLRLSTARTRTAER